MKRIFTVLVFIFLILCKPVNSQSDDITQIGKVNPLFYSSSTLQQEIRTAYDELLNLEISSIIVESQRILVRFYVTDLSNSWKLKISDTQRLYGSYLPIAEVLLNNGEFLTPSSASRYSLLEYNNRLILGGLMIFHTNQAPQSFYLNFNQLPFDTQPLSEGFTIPIILAAAHDTIQRTESQLRDTKNDLEFTISAIAQTTEETMIQPAVRLERLDESLSKFGWITVTDTSDQKRFAVTRGNLYGFNLADDTEYSPAHAYVFAPVTHESPLEISMDHAFVVRTFNPAHKIIDLTGKLNNDIHLDEDFVLKIKRIELLADNNKIRLIFDSGDKIISDISFKFVGLLGTQNPSVSCGIEPGSEDFGCDLYFDDISFPLNQLSISIDAVEYRKDGPWTLTWHPSAMDSKPENSVFEINFDVPFVSKYPIEKKQPVIVQTVLESLEQCRNSLILTPGWIHESYELDYKFTDKIVQDLISVDQFNNYLTHYVTEFWYHVGENSKIQDVISIIRLSKTNNIYTAILQSSGSTLDLIHALRSRNVDVPQITFNCFDDFHNITESSAILISEEKCSEGSDESYCLWFSQSLNGMQDNSNTQQTIFRISPENNFVIEESIIYERRSLHMTKKTLVLEKVESLPSEILTMMESIK